MKKIVVFTGAGMSAESGISTFRDSGGLWDQYRIEDVATPEGWRKNPELVLEFYNQRRRQLLEVTPNEGHAGLAELEANFDVEIVTQNVDNLHERAGSSHVLHLHGELMKVRSTGSGAEVFDVESSHPDVKLGDKCPKGYQLRPHIVWFGEAVPEFEHAANLVSNADMLVIIGTSMQVYPAAGLVNYVKHGTPVWLIDPNVVSNLPAGVRLIAKGASEGVAELKTLLMKR
ncbi:MAG: NAD-dependent deacylase [Bacteroidales bacterium]|jgi:NAD-dependent deacetylase|nr:NAD-dependent deacylase [Bacteroidales bacterium]